MRKSHKASSSDGFLSTFDCVDTFQNARCKMLHHKKLSIYNWSKWIWTNKHTHIFANTHKQTHIHIKDFEGSLCYNWNKLMDLLKSNSRTVPAGL